MSARGVDKGRITPSYASGNGGIVVYDDGDIEDEMGREREAYSALLDMPEVDEDEYVGSDSDDDADEEGSGSGTKKRKSWSGREDEGESDEEDGPPRQRRRSNSVRGLSLDFVSLGSCANTVFLGLFCYFITHSSAAQWTRFLKLLTVRHSSF